MITIEIRKELKSGVIELAILALLVRREMYGYELSQ
ncbi:MAG TPA: PadR family transcriptional regulator, partial [Firmicutes bacterium]|nr:PadR family transcriptional regulator [Bacillota bacterium]